MLHDNKFIAFTCKFLFETYDIRTLLASILQFNLAINLCQAAFVDPINLNYFNGETLIGSFVSCEHDLT